MLFLLMIPCLFGCTSDEYTLVDYTDSPQVIEDQTQTSSSQGLEGNTSFPRVQIRDTEVRHLQSTYVDQEYEIDIFFPTGYADEMTRYPVVYVLDAEYNFGCVAYITRRLIKNDDIPKVLVVGIAYDTSYEDFYKKRSRDLTPASDIHGYHTGGAENFTQFLEHELFPFIESNYRTIPEDRTIVGHSFGGLYGSYVLLKHTNLFNRYLIVSP